MYVMGDIHGQFDKMTAVLRSNGLIDHCNCWAGGAATLWFMGDYFDRFGDRVWHVHLVDGNPSGHKAWGDGNLPLDDYLRDLRRFGYDGLMTAEIFGRPYIYEPTAAHRKNLTAIGAAFDRIDAVSRSEHAS